MKAIYLLLGHFLVLSLSYGQPDEVWESIFNGRDLTGWSVVDPPARVMVKDSSIILNMTAHTSRHAFVRTNATYCDFIFEVEYKRDRALDSGILFRAIDAPDSAFSRLFGYMVKIDPSPTRFWTGGVFLDFGNGITWLNPLEGDLRARSAEHPEGNWNRFRIEVIGQLIKVWLNDIPTVHMRDDKYSIGYIAFKIHYLTREAELEDLEISYRNARIITKEVQRYARAIDLPLIDTRQLKDIIYFR